MTTIIGISGSLRKASYNAGLLHAAVEVTPETVRMDTASIEGIPLYNADVEASEGVPAVVQQIKDRIAASDGLLLVTPEYDNSILWGVQKRCGLDLQAAIRLRTGVSKPSGWYHRRLSRQ